MTREHVPETFRDALEAGLVRLWLRSQIAWGAGFVVLMGVLILISQFISFSKSDVAGATTHVREMWAKGDQAGAIAYYRDVAAEGAPEAEYMMGVLYKSATDKLHDDVEAAKWFQKASDQNNAAATNELAQLYRDGKGVAKDDVKSLSLFCAAANAGDADAEAALARFYEDGLLGLPQDLTQAGTWYGAAAAQGNIYAQINLGHLLFEGVAGTRDVPGAYRWSSVAAAHSEPDTDAYRIASSNAAESRALMTPDQIAQADAWVKDWKAKAE